MSEAARTDLLGSQVLSSLLEKVENVPHRANLILVVEGQTDHDYLQMAAQKLAIPIDEIHIAWQRGVTSALVQSLAIAAQHAPARVVVALFDTDEDGKVCYDLLSKRFSWKDKAGDGLHALNYEKWLPGFDVPVEAEDLFPNATIDAFLAEPGNKLFCTGTKLRKKSGLWHYDLTREGKIAFVAWLREHGSAEAFEPWRPVLEHLRTLIKR